MSWGQLSDGPNVIGTKVAPALANVKTSYVCTSVVDRRIRRRVVAGTEFVGKRNPEVNVGNHGHFRKNKLERFKTFKLTKHS